MYLQMKIFGFALDGIAQMPVVILKDEEEKHTVPVWMNATESVSFAAEFVTREISVRNGRKDAFAALVERLEMKVTSICVDSLKDGAFISSVVLTDAGGEEMKLNLHVSEAMLLSLKYRLPVMVNSELLSQTATLDLTDDGFVGEGNARRFVDFLDQLDPSEMGKFPM